MKLISNIVAGLLGLLFVIFGLNYFLHFIAMPAPPEGSPPALFMGATVPTGYLGFVHALEILGGVLVALPKLRNLGLLILGPIVVNILCFHIFLANGAGLFGAPLLVAVLALFVLWSGRREWMALIRR